MEKVAQHQPPREACRRAGVDPSASFHILRNTYATQPLQAEVPLPVLRTSQEMQRPPPPSDPRLGRLLLALCLRGLRTSSGWSF